MVIIRTADDDEESELRIERNPNGKIVKSESLNLDLCMQRGALRAYWGLISIDQLKKVVELEWQRRTKAKL
jgi:hypothetical protein